MNGKGITLAGTIVNIFPAEVYGNFEKRLIWLKQPDENKYPETWAIEFQQGDCNTLDKYKVGQSVEVTIDIKGKGWEKNGKKNVFNTLKATGIKLSGTTKPEPSNRQKIGRNDLDPTAYNDNGHIDY